MAEAAILNVALGKHGDDKAWGREMSRLLVELVLLRGRPQSTTFGLWSFRYRLAIAKVWSGQDSRRMHRVAFMIAWISLRPAAANRADRTDQTRIGIHRECRRLLQRFTWSLSL
jgi:hypothetical protein